MHMFDQELTPSRPCDEPGMLQLYPYRMIVAGALGLPFRGVSEEF